jgi:hypothetical protein
MRSVPIASIEIDGGGRLLVRPSATSGDDFEFVYRTATGVRWRGADGSFYPVEVGSLSTATWFMEIVAAAKGEFGVNLQITQDTTWVSVPVGVQQEIESLVSRRDPV